MAVYFLTWTDAQGNLAMLGNPDTHKAQFYCGTTKDVDARLAEHKAGRGAAITRAAVERGYDLRVILVIPGGRKEERRIKNLKGHRKFIERYFRRNGLDGSILQ